MDAAAPVGEWSPARVYLAVAGAYLIVVGIAGFLIQRSFPIGAAEVESAGSAEVFGVFETNGWHNLAALVFGIVAVYFLIRPDRAAFGALIVGVPNAFVAIVFALADPKTFWFASNGADSVAHVLLGAGGIAAALMSRSSTSDMITRMSHEDGDVLPER
jgi:preprotein translocase subunit SecG